MQAGTRHCPSCACTCARKVFRKAVWPLRIAVTQPAVHLARVTREPRGQADFHLITSIATQALPPTSAREGAVALGALGDDAGRGGAPWKATTQRHESRADRRTGKLYLQRRPSWVRRYLVAIMMTPRATEQ